MTPSLPGLNLGRIDRRGACTTLAATCCLPACALQMTPVTPGTAAAPTAYTALVQRHAEAHGFNGVALVGVGVAVLAVCAVGMANTDDGVPMTVDTRFETGSMSKWVAAVTALRLVDRGLLGLDAPITRVLTAYRADTGSRLTLRHLMSHSSGLPNQVIGALRADPAMAAQPLAIDEAVRRHASGDLAFPPGTSWDYAHSNWLIVVALIERVTGQPYAQAVHDAVVHPLRMTGSGIFAGDSADIPGMARGYTALRPAPQRRVNLVPAYLAGAGGFYSTAGDLLRLLHGVLDGAMLSAETRRELLTVHRPEQYYALGGRRRSERVAGVLRDMAWEDGANGGFRAVARRVLADGHSVIVLNNSSADPRQLSVLADALLAQSYS